MKPDFIPLYARAFRVDKTLICHFLLLFALLGGLLSLPAHVLPESCLVTYIETGAVPVGRPCR
jgi:hypothetical protein